MHTQIHTHTLPLSHTFTHTNTHTYTTIHSSSGGGDAYLPIPGMAQLKAVLEAKLAEYNEGNAMMDLVLFDEASVYLWLGMVV